LVAALAGIAVIALVAMPRPSEAAALLSILKRTQAGIVHSVVYSNGRKTMETYQNGVVLKISNPEGGEQLFEPGRSWTRHREGYMTVEHRSASHEFMKGASLQRFLEKDGNARVRKATIGDLTRFSVEGQIIDAQGVRRWYRAAMDVDASSRPIVQTSDMEGMGTSRVEWTYDGTAADLKLTPVEKDRVYDLSVQRASLLTMLASTEPGGTRVVRAYLDESGLLGVLVSVPVGVLPRNQPVFVNGQRYPPHNLAFNEYAGFRGDAAAEWKTAVAQAQSGVAGADARVDQIREQMELDAPVAYNGLNLILRTVKLDRQLKAPFTLQFPFWQGDQRVSVQHPMIRDGQAFSPSLVDRQSVIVSGIERTSSVIRLLSPMNLPFWQTSGQSGQVTKAVEN
jgi:hypothetical protein